MYIVETELKNIWSVRIALSKIYGLNVKKSFLICKKLGFSDNLKISDLSNSKKEMLIRYLNNSSFLLNIELKKKNTFFKQKSVEIKLYKGLRKLNGYPVRGQRTRSNAKTARKKLNFT